MDASTRKEDTIKELQRDLAKKYRIHGARIEEIWRSFDKGQRARAVKAGAAEGAVLKEPGDRLLGNVYKIMPETNLRDITEPGSDYLLDILKYRATKSLCEQYREGANNAPGDHAVILHNMRVNNLRHISDFKYCFILFLNKKDMGSLSMLRVRRGIKKPWKFVFLWL